MSIKSKIAAYLQAVIDANRREWRNYFAIRREAVKQKKQTHLHQKRKGIRPPNPFARRTMLFKRIHNIQ